jgi:hypothetical protein
LKNQLDNINKAKADKDHDKINSLNKKIDEIYERAKDQGNIIL